MTAGIRTVGQQDHRTTVELTWRAGRIEHWIRFGRIAEQQRIEPHRRIVAFDPGAVFAFVRWAANDYGTVVSRIDILRAVSPGESYQTVPLVRPGGEILLRTHGWPKVEKVLNAIDAIEALGLDPADAAPDYWRHVSNRLAVNQPFSAYGRQRHRAWLLRRELQP